MTTALEDVEQDFNADPRVTVIKNLRTRFDAQDMVDTIRKVEDGFRGMSESKLINASGKEDLGGGALVGITYQFQNNQAQFEDRQTPAETGAITTGSVAPIGGKIQVIDTAADFVATLVKRGSFIINWDDRSIVSIDSVVDLNTLLVKVPTSGLGNTYDVLDNYSVFNVTPVFLGGGNATAVDAVPVTIEPAVPSVGTYLTLEKASGSTLVGFPGAVQTLIEDIHGQVQRSIFIDTEAIPVGDGYQQTPYNNWSDAIDDAEANNIKSLVVLADATVDRLIKNFVILGIGGPVIDLNGQNVDKSEFQSCDLTGAMSGRIDANRCTLLSVTGLDGHFHNCDLDGTLEIAVAGDVMFDNNPHAEGSGAESPIFSMNASSIGATMNMRGYSGEIVLTNCDHADDKVALDISEGKVTLDATCTDGSISVRGNSQFTNNSTGSTVDTSALIQPSKLLTIAKFLGLK